MPFLRSSGKHAKPSKTAPAVVAGGMTAAFFVADGGSPAHAAASNSDWERLAQCESGGNWSINTGNGYYGGLQFNLPTWRSVGGSGRPDQASKSEQIKRANILHDSRGFKPWPACSRKLGLTGGGSGSSTGSTTTTTTKKTTATKPKPAPTRAAAPARDDDDRTTTRASRSRRTAAAPKAAPVVTGKYQPSKRAGVVVALAPTAPPAFSAVLSTADVRTKSAAVLAWQKRMAARGWTIDADGHFGPQSSSVAKRFAEQKRIKVATPGTVDRNVWNAAWQLPVT